MRDIAQDTGKEPFDALLDIVVADKLRTGLRPPIGESEADWELRAKVWQDPRAVVGGSDAGAHLDMMCGAIYSTSMLGDGVRARHLLSWEEAVRQLTDVPARLYGLRDRGRLAAGLVGRHRGLRPRAGGARNRTHTRRPSRRRQSPLRRRCRDRARHRQRRGDRPVRRIHREPAGRGPAVGDRDRHRDRRLRSRGSGRGRSRPRVDEHVRFGEQSEREHRAGRRRARGGCPLCHRGHRARPDRPP